MGKQPNEPEKEIQTKRLRSPHIFWCPGPEESPSRHQFTTEKIYYRTHDSDNAFVICSEHYIAIPVRLVDSKQTQEPSVVIPVKNADGASLGAPDIKQRFFAEHLCNRIGDILSKRARQVEWFLKDKEAGISYLPPLARPFRLFEFYANSKRSGFADREYNREADKVPTLLGKLKRECNLPCTFVDVNTMTSEQLQTAYVICAHSASTSHVYYKRGGFSVADFLDGKLGSSTPALFVYSEKVPPEMKVDFVLPHRAPDWTTVTIYAFLSVLETMFKTDLKSKLNRWIKAESKLDS